MYKLIVLDKDNDGQVFEEDFEFNDLRSIFVDSMQRMLVDMWQDIRDNEEEKVEDEEEE